MAQRRPPISRDIASIPEDVWDASIRGRIHTRRPRHGETLLRCNAHRFPGSHHLHVGTERPDGVMTLDSVSCLRRIYESGASFWASGSPDADRFPFGSA